MSNDSGKIDQTRFIIPTKKICVAIPSYTGSISHATFHALLQASAASHQQGWVLELMTREADSCIQRARSALFTAFFEKDYTDLVFVDADIGFSGDGWVRLLSHKVDVVGGAYRARSPDEHYILRPLNNELGRDPETNLFEVEGVGTGFFRITRSAAKRMVAAYPDDWYTDPTCPNMIVRDLFSFSVEDHQLYSEDYNFCRRWRKIGGKVWADADQVLDHVGYATFRGCMVNWLQAQMPPVPSHVPVGKAAEYFANKAPPMTVEDLGRQFVADAEAAEA